MNTGQVFKSTLGEISSRCLMNEFFSAKDALAGPVLAALFWVISSSAMQGAVLLPEAVPGGADGKQAASKAKEAVAEHVVRVLVTAQPHDFARPWSKRAPVARKAMGTVLAGDRVLVTAETVANATYIELESADGENKQPAAVEHVDYEANLALLKPEGSGFLKGRKGLELSRLKAGDFFTVCQLEANGNLLLSRGQMNTAEVARYPLEEFAFLVCRASCSLQMKDATLSLPVVLDGKLAGLMLRYDAPSSILDILPAPVIEHFLKDAADGIYQGFPRMGAAFASTRDPQLRRYLKLPSGNGGVLITQVSKGSPAEGAGMLAGDVLMEIAGKPVDADGNYRDEEFGRISLGHLVSTHHFEGDDIPVRILRGGEAKEVRVRLARRPVDQYVSEPYVIDRAPRYYVLGGLVLQELNRQYLREFGTDWARKAPMELIYLDSNQAEMERMGRRKIVMISRVLPSNLTVGYEELRHVMVDAINGVRIQSLEDVPKALSATRDGLIKIELEHEPSLLYLDAEGVEQVAPAIQRAYGIPELSRLR